MSKKKILIYEFQDLRFASRARKEAFSLSTEFEVQLIGFNRQIEKKKTTNLQNLTIVEFPILFKNSKSFLSKVINIFILNFKIGLYIISTKADVYFMHNLKLFYPTIFAVLLHRARLIYDAHELHMAKRPDINTKQRLLTKYDIIKERYLVKNADVIIQASEQRAIYFKDFYSTRQPLVIENFANYIKLEKHKGESLRTFLGLSEEVKVIIFTGFISIGGNQRIDNVIESLRFLDKNIHFCVLGFGNEIVKQQLNTIAKDNNVLDRFHFLSPVLSNEVVPYISQANVAIIPIYATSLNSRHSALNKVSQSLMAGLPLACSNYENLENVAKFNPIGIVGDTFDVTEPKDISEAIKNCIINEELYSKNAIILANDYYNWEKQEPRLYSMISNVESKN